MYPKCEQCGQAMTFMPRGCPVCLRQFCRDCWLRHSCDDPVEEEETDEDE